MSQKFVFIVRKGGLTGKTFTYAGRQVLLVGRRDDCSIVLPDATVAKLFDEVSAFPGYELTVDLERQVIVKPDGAEIAFDVQPFRKYCLLNGFDDIGLTLRQQDKIKAFEANRLATKPWLAHTLSA